MDLFAIIFFVYLGMVVSCQLRTVSAVEIGTVISVISVICMIGDMFIKELWTEN